MTQSVNRRKFQSTLTVLFVLFQFSESITTKCPENWFRSRCQYKCNCRGNNCTSEGLCPLGCHENWFGPECQYVNVADGISEADDQGCNRVETINSKLEVPFRLQTQFTWMRLRFKENIKTVNFTLLTTSDKWTPCNISDILQIDGVTLDIFCQDTNEISKSVFIEVTAAVTLCSIYVSGGRNVALKAFVEQSSTFSNGTYDESFARSENSVDGNTSVDYRDKSCSRTEQSRRSRLNILFQELHTIHAYKLYANFSTTYRLYLRDSEGETFSANHKMILTSISNYTAFVPIAPVKSVFLRNTLIFICEIEIFGDVLCNGSKYGRECEKDCFCFDQSEKCKVSTGGCVSGCPVGYAGEDCKSVCPSGQYGQKCRHSCSVNCWENKSCNHINGSCLEGCQDGYRGHNCTEKCPSGQYGQSCQQVCSVNCAGIENCNHINGSCLEGCQDGFMGHNCTENTKCGPDKYICANSTRCLPRTVLCDGQRDCPNGDDEDRNVCTRYCEPNDHQCTNGQCIPLQLFCNGTKCKDGSDISENSLVMDVQPGVISTGLTINCSSYLLDTSCPDNWKLLTLSRLNKTSQEFEESLRFQIDYYKDLQLISDEQIEDSDVTFGDFLVSLNVHNPQNGDEFKCEVSDYDNYSKNITKKTEIYKVVLNTTSAENEGHENTSTVQPPTAKQFTEFLLSVFPPEVADGFTDSLEITCVYRNAPLTNLFSMSILHSVSVEKPNFKYLSSVSSFNQKIQNHFPSLRNVNGTIDPIEGSHVSLIFEDPKVRKTGLYKCEVIGFDLEQGKPVIDSKEFLVEASDITIETVIGKIHNETSLIRESLVSLQSESKNSTDRMKEIQSNINQFKLDMNESISGLEADRDKTENIIHNITAFNNEFHNNLKSLNKSVSGLESNLDDVKTKFDKVEKLVNDSRKELEIVKKNKSASEDFIQKHLQKMESSITQQKDFTQVAVDKLEVVKKRQDVMEDKLSKLDSGSNSFTQRTIESLFIGSSPFKGRRYWLTRNSYNISITDAETMCLRYGGYLLEIDSHDEFNFVRTFIQNNSVFKAVFTGGTDSLSENVWVHRFSLLKMKVFNWHRGEPNNDAKVEHCECFWKDYSYYMNDCKCDFERHGNCGFICEVPEFDLDISSSFSLGSSRRF